MNIRNQIRTNLLLSVLKKQYSTFNPSDYINNEDVFKNLKSVLIIAPHPDDEIIGCGGCIQVLNDYECNIDILFCTQESDKSISDKKETDTVYRREEALQVAHLMNYNIFFLDGAERLLQEKKQYDHLKKRISTYLNVNNYETIFIPNYIDLHPDHRKCFECVTDLLGENKIHILSPYIYLYEVWGPLSHANVRIPLTENMFTKKLKAIEFYETQTTIVDYQCLIRKINEYRNQKMNLLGFFEFFQQIEYRIFSKMNQT